MKSKSKIGDFLLGLAASLAVLLSIALWIFIMSNDQYFSHIKQSDNVSHKQAATQQTKSLNNIYVPTDAYGFTNGQLNRLYDAKNNLPLEFTKTVRDAKVKEITQVNGGVKQYEQMLDDPAYLQLAYPDEVPLKLFIKKKAAKPVRFCRMFISSSNDYIYLTNDETYQIYRANLAGANFALLRHYAKNAKTKFPVKFIRLKNGYSASYIKAGSWNVYSYLTSQQANSYFLTRLLGTSNVTKDTSKHGTTTYSHNYYTRLQIPNEETKDHEYLYTHYKKSDDEGGTDHLLESIEQVNRIGLNQQNLRFFGANDSSVDYTNYIEGIPVFLKQKVQIASDFSADTVTLAFNSLDLQIPIPFDGQTKNLPATADVIDTLVNKGLRREEIQRVVVGLEVEKDQSRSDLVNLVPTYFIEAYNQWDDLAGWEKQAETVDLQKVPASNRSEEGN